MKDFKININLQQNQILHIVKVASLFFSVVAFFQYHTKNTYTFYFSLSDEMLLSIALVIVLATYIAWNAIQSEKRSHPAIAAWLESAIFLVISFLSVMLTGTYQSDYKFLFLFVIISASIEYGMKTSLTIAGISAAIILGIDLVFGPKAVINIHVESDLVLACAFLLISWTIGFYVNIVRQHIARLNDLVNIDSLTGLYNHRFFYDSLTQITNACKMNHANISLLFVDIDYFKYYNDLNGHQKGDEVLTRIAHSIMSVSREKDIMSRYGGDEFAVILPDTSEKEAFAIADKLRCMVQNEYFAGQEYLPNKNLTISIGISSFPTKAKTEQEIVKQADDALYRAKFLKKNSVESYYSILDELQNHIDENQREIIASIKTLIAVINSRDEYTFKHVERVVAYCLLMADYLQMEEHTKKRLVYAAYMHDIGKINIPKEILIKSSPLTSEEWELLKRHPENGVDIIKNVSVLKEVLPIILQHHERYDGTGYPNKLKANEISYLARILTVIDSFDAMTSSRPYQEPKTFAEAFVELEKCSGTQFDPEIAHQFIQAVRNEVRGNQDHD